MFLYSIQTDTLRFEDLFTLNLGRNRAVNELKHTKYES